MAKKKAARNATDTKGPQLDALLEFEDKFCRLDTRRSLEKRVEKKTIEARIGLFLSDAHSFFKQKNDDDNHLRKKDVAFLIGESSTHYSSFLNGNASETWVSRGAPSFQCLLTGKNSKPHELPESQERAAAIRIFDYFFRGSERSPSFFSNQRVGSVHAWSYRELANEIEWYARHAERSGDQSCTITFVSGGPRFFSDPQVNETSIALQACQKAELPVAFYFPHDEREAEFSANRFLEVAERVPTVRPIAEPTPTSGFFTPNTAYLFFKSQSDYRLWRIQSQASDGEEIIDEAPTAFRSSKADVNSFIGWLEKVDATLADVEQTPKRRPRRAERHG